MEARAPFSGSHSASPIASRPDPRRTCPKRRGEPMRQAKDVRHLVVEPRREHSRKPDCIRDRIERLVSTPTPKSSRARPNRAGTVGGIRPASGSREGWFRIKLDRIRFTETERTSTQTRSVNLCASPAADKRGVLSDVPARVSDRVNGQETVVRKREAVVLIIGLAGHYRDLDRHGHVLRGWLYARIRLAFARWRDADCIKMPVKIGCCSSLLRGLIRRRSTNLVSVLNRALSHFFVVSLKASPPLISATQK